MAIGLSTSGLYRLRGAVELLSGHKTRSLSRIPIGIDAIAGWGHKPTANKARKLARRRDLPYIAFEDGFLRSVHPGNGELPLSMVMDRTGIYYDARQPCDLEAYVRHRAAANSDRQMAQAAIGELRRLQLSKYNWFSLSDISSLELKTQSSKDRILVVDQTAGDASIPGAFATAETFTKMLCAAVDENPSAEILVRVHPETMTGRKSGHLGPRELSKLAESSAAIEYALQQNRLRLTPEPINPWALLEASSKVYCVSSQLGFEGLIAGCEVHCFGAAFYGGWGLAEDRFEKPDWHRGNATIEALFAAVYFDYCRYIDWENLKEISFECAVKILAEKVEEFRNKEGQTSQVT